MFVLIVSKEGNLLGLCEHLNAEGNEAKLFIDERSRRWIGKDLVTKQEGGILTRKNDTVVIPTLNKLLDSKFSLLIFDSLVYYNIATGIRTNSVKLTKGTPYANLYCYTSSGSITDLALIETTTTLSNDNLGVNLNEPTSCVLANLNNDPLRDAIIGKVLSPLRQFCPNGPSVISLDESFEPLEIKEASPLVLYTALDSCSITNYFAGEGNRAAFRVGTLVSSAPFPFNDEETKVKFSFPEAASKHIWKLEATKEDEELVSKTGKLLVVTAIGTTLKRAADRVSRTVGNVIVSDKQVRSDMKAPLSKE